MKKAEGFRPMTVNEATALLKTRYRETRKLLPRRAGRAGVVYEANAQLAAPDYGIAFGEDGRFTIAIVRDPLGNLFVGIARRAPGDKNNPAVGRALALQRAAQAKRHFKSGANDGSDTGSGAVAPARQTPGRSEQAAPAVGRRNGKRSRREAAADAGESRRGAAAPQRARRPRGKD